MSVFSLKPAAASVAAALILCACSASQETPLQPVKTGQSGILPTTQTPQQTAEAVNNYQAYQNALTAIKNSDELPAQQFLAAYRNGAMVDAVRNRLLQAYGKRGDWTAFRQQYAQLEHAGREEATRCYAALSGIEPDNELLQRLARSTGRLPEGCNEWLNQAAAAGKISPADGWRRVRFLLAADQITVARGLAQALGSPLPSPLSSSDGSTRGAQEALLYQVVNKKARGQANAANVLQALSPRLSAEQSGFAWAQLALTQSYNQNAATALSYFDRADRGQLSDEMWEWYARSALRLQDWSRLSEIIRAMPQDLQDNPTWQYWLARSYKAQNRLPEAQELFRRAAASGRNFYALLSTEALGQKADVRNNVADSTAGEVKQIAQDNNILRSIHLFRASQSEGDRSMRQLAQQEWRYAVRDYDEDRLLAASALAKADGFYEMGIYSADKTTHKLNYQLRYIAPFKELTVPYAQQAGVDPAWVYGLIRQESRFMIGARSRTGAAGLMQVMPATAAEIANKIGMSADELHTMQGNIRMGTWYLGDIRNRLGDEVLATAGYNAGPSRARRWQADRPLEGAIYAETIPFDETRTYVKNVMTNATYYANLFDEPQKSLTKRMGTIPAR